MCSSLHELAIHVRLTYSGNLMQRNIRESQFSSPCDFLSKNVCLALMRSRWQNSQFLRLETNPRYTDV